MPVGRARTRHFDAAKRAQARHGQAGCEGATFEAIRAIGAISADLGQAPGAVALAWLLHQPAVTAVLAGARTPDQARQNVQAAGLKLSTETLAALAEATEPVKKALGTNLDMWMSDSRIR